MVQIIPSQDITLAYLKQRFSLYKSNDQQFFTECFNDLPAISELEKQYLDRVKNNYLSLTETSPLLEDAVKLVVLSPLLDLACFYQPPFYIVTEKSIDITEEIFIDAEMQTEVEKEIIKGRIDVLVIKSKLWLLIIESKRSNFSLAKAIPQALTYMLAAPDTDDPVYSLVMNGEDFQFMKLSQKDTPIYALSDRFTLYRRDNELYQVLRILKKIGQSFL
ncbi:hypothetical protein Nos7524_1327 [Nostoc sp. PCC 7524]|uniref:hypothetical protein n=1 Tax=Nostoc sp. (strain ATCC 29411 / PCC 7524) TaxID=28072 RepID=UPI00029F3A00|nr:hypothetical protein [Nostoc sp. PCC 7524]AFY47208.1 hypothetical protein Nos7524_1327 [Nostoc sp. PCC 7524]